MSGNKLHVVFQSLLILVLLLGLAAVPTQSVGAVAFITISGNAGVGNADIAYTGGSVTADGTGAYSFQVARPYTGTVTPSLACYTFTPPSRSYTAITASQLNQDFTAALNTQTISGNVGVAGATITYTGGSTTSDGTGFYTFTVNCGWSGTVTPTHPGYTFEPLDKTYTDVKIDQTGQDFTPTINTYTISGNAVLPDVTITYTGGTTTTDATGFYTFTVDYGWDGTVTPSLAGHTFDPVDRTYTDVAANHTDQDFTPTINTYTISGNAVLPDVTITYTGGTTTTDATGFYTFTVDYGWDGTVTPSLAGHTFDPVDRTYTDVAANHTDQDFTPTIDTFVISGNAGVADATITYTGGSTSADGTGFYTFTVDYGWSGTVTPSKTYYTFQPSSNSYDTVTGDHTGQDFVATLHLFADVPVPGKDWMEPWIVAFYNAGITTGCGTNPLVYCPENNVTRAEMAVFLLRAKHGAGYTPPAATGIFTDVPVTGKAWMQPWIEQFYREGITTGCGAGPMYCPEANVTRAEMAVFILRATHVPGWVPPASTGIFTDVPVTGKAWMQPWIEEFYREGITTGCGAGPMYCPEASTTRAEMAVFIDRAYHLH